MQASTPLIELVEHMTPLALPARTVAWNAGR